MNTLRYCFTERGAALFRYLDLQSLNTQMNSTLGADTPESAAGNRHKTHGRMWTSWVLPKKAVHMHAHWTLLGT